MLEASLDLLQIIVLFHYPQDSNLLYEIDVCGPPQVLCLNGNDGGRKSIS